jgi:flagellar protein FlaJ
LFSEVRKTGLSPERCIILVSSRNYRALTPVVERAASALSLGLSLEESLRKALKGVKEWFVIAAFRFLTDSIIVGGGSPEVVDTLARFTQVLSELEEETRKRMRTQVILPYMGAILLASMPVIILYMLLALAKIPISAVTPMVLVLALGSLVNSYIMGIIAGKASQTTIAAGFKHAIILTAVTVATLTATFIYIGA